MSARSPHLLALMTVPLSVRVSAGAGISSAVRMALTPGIASASLRIDVLHPGVGHGAEQQPAKQHAFGAKVLCIFCLAGDLGIDIGSRIVLADQLVAGAVDASVGLLCRFSIHGRSQTWSALLMFSAPRIMASRILL